MTDRKMTYAEWAAAETARWEAQMRAPSATPPQSEALREALEWIARKADGFCPTCEGEPLIDPEDGTAEPCFDSIHVISAKAKVALLAALTPHPDTEAPDHA
jgi:hypothetical protein